MIDIPSKGALVCVLVVAGAGAALLAGLSRNTNERSEQHVSAAHPPVAPVTNGWDGWAPDPTVQGWEMYTGLDALQGEVSGEALFASLPPELIEMARETSWTECTNEALALFLEGTFDYDDDGSLDDEERIIAVRALRDAVWPDAFGDGSEAPSDDVEEDPSGGVAAAELSPRDRRLYHDVDEARRRDHEEAGTTDDLDPSQREQIQRRFSIEPDGHVSVAELSRFMARFNAASDAADLDGNGVVGEPDLRIFLDVASPIDDSGGAK